MYSVTELEQQNQEITQLCDVLSVLLEKPSLHDNPFVCELLQRFKEKVWVHLVFEDNTLYAELARHPDEQISEVAKQFQANARSVKHQFSEFIRHWCKPQALNRDQHLLKKECEDIFTMIRERVSFENERMFPLLK